MPGARIRKTTFSRFSCHLANDWVLPKGAGRRLESRRKGEVVLLLAWAETVCGLRKLPDVLQKEKEGSQDERNNRRKENETSG